MNDNPYYEFEGDSINKIDLYLNPIVEVLTKPDNPKVVDGYNVIVIAAQATPNDYTHIYGNFKTKEVYLTPIWDSQESLKLKESNIGAQIANILEEVRQNSK